MIATNDTTDEPADACPNGVEGCPGVVFDYPDGPLPCIDCFLAGTCPAGQVFCEGPDAQNPNGIDGARCNDCAREE